MDGWTNGWTDGWMDVLSRKQYSQATFTIARQTGDVIGGDDDDAYTLYPWHDDSFDVFDDVFPFLRIFRGFIWHQRAKVARLDLCHRGPLSDVLQVVGHIVHHLLSSPSKL